MQKKIQQQINDTISEKKSQRMQGRLGTLISYDPFDNTATVQVSKESTDEIDELLTKVMCPRVLGVQTVSPSPGILCWVVFKDDNVTQPLITNYYNHRYSQYDYPKQSRAINALPTYLMGL